MDVRYILMELASPLIESDLDQISHAVQTMHGYQKSKAKVLRALEEASDRRAELHSRNGHDWTVWPNGRGGGSRSLRTTRGRTTLTHL